MITLNRSLCLLCAGAVLAGISACATTPKRAEVTEERTAVVTVQSIDVPHRLVTVRDASGDSSTYYIRKSVKDFPQAKVGDQVRIRYQESIAVEMKPRGEGTPEMQVTRETTEPEYGGTERGSTRNELTATVRIDKVDPKANTVTFTGPRGQRTLYVQKPAMQEFVKKLRPGDAVEVSYAEAIAISLEPI